MGCPHHLNLNFSFDTSDIQPLNGFISKELRPLVGTCLIWAKSPDPMVNPYISTQSPTYIMGTCLAWTKPLAPLVLIVVFIVLMKLNKKVLTI